METQEVSGSPAAPLVPAGAAAGAELRDREALRVLLAPVLALWQEAPQEVVDFVELGKPLSEEDRAACHALWNSPDSDKPRNVNTSLWTAWRLIARAVAALDTYDKAPTQQLYAELASIIAQAETHYRTGLVIDMLQAALCEAKFVRDAELARALDGKDGAVWAIWYTTWYAPRTELGDFTSVQGYVPQALVELRALCAAHQHIVRNELDLIPTRWEHPIEPRMQAQAHRPPPGLGQLPALKLTNAQWKEFVRDAQIELKEGYLRNHAERDLACAAAMEQHLEWGHPTRGRRFAEVWKEEWDAIWEHVWLGGPKARRTVRVEPSEYKEARARRLLARAQDLLLTAQEKLPRVAECIQAHGLAARLLDDVRENPCLACLAVWSRELPDSDVWADWARTM